MSPRAPPDCSAVRVGPTAPAAPGPGSQTAHGSPHHRAGGKAERTRGRTADCVHFDSAATSRRAPGLSPEGPVQVGPNGGLPMSPGLAQERDEGGQGAGVDSRRLLLDGGTVSRGWDGPGGKLLCAQGVLLTSRLAPGPLTGNPRVLSSSIAPKIYKGKQTCQRASGGPERGPTETGHQGPCRPRPLRSWPRPTACAYAAWQELQGSAARGPPTFSMWVR